LINHKVTPGENGSGRFVFVTAIVQQSGQKYAFVRQSGKI
jgi:hypothetical protein